MAQQKFCPLHAILAPDVHDVARIVRPPCDPKYCALGNPSATGCVLRDCAGSMTGLFLLLMGKETVIPRKPKGAPDEQQHP